MCPAQVGIVPIREEHNEFARDIENLLEYNGIRAEVDLSPKNMNDKIKNFRNLKDPYILVIGDKEVESKTVSVNIRGQKVQLHDIPVDTFVEVCKKMNAERTKDLVTEM